MLIVSNFVSFLNVFGFVLLYANIWNVYEQWRMPCGTIISC